MIKEMYKLFMGGMMILVLSCKGTNSDVSESKDILLEVDNVGEGLLLSEKFTDVEIIPLENNPKAILSDVRKMIVTDRGMYFWDNGPKPQVLFFGHDGTFRNSIGSMGHAKGEYQMIMSIASTSSGDTVAIVKYPNADLFDGGGKFLSTFEIRDDVGTEDLLMADEGIYVGYYHRQKESIVSLHSWETDGVVDIVRTSNDPIRHPLSQDNGNSLQQDGDKVYCLDIFGSAIYSIDRTNPSDVVKYSLGMDGILTEDIARNAANDDDLDGYFHISSYNVCNGVVRGCIERNADSFESYDFKFSTAGGNVSLMRHADMGYLFDCCHSGYFYRIVSAGRILDYMGRKDMDGVRNLLGDKLNELSGKVSPSDNHYVLKMRPRE